MSHHPDSPDNAGFETSRSLLRPSRPATPPHQKISGLLAIPIFHSSPSIFASEKSAPSLRYAAYKKERTILHPSPIASSSQENLTLDEQEREMIASVEALSLQEAASNLDLSIEVAAVDGGEDGNTHTHVIGYERGAGIGIGSSVGFGKNSLGYSRLQPDPSLLNRRPGFSFTHKRPRVIPSSYSNQSSSSGSMLASTQGVISNQNPPGMSYSREEFCLEEGCSSGG